MEKDKYYQLGPYVSVRWHRDERELEIDSERATVYLGHEEIGSLAPYLLEILLKHWNNKS